MKLNCHLLNVRTVSAALLLLLFASSLSYAEKLLSEPTLIHFETASAKLSAQELSKLKKLAGKIKQQSIKIILVEGYCDRRRIVNDYEYITNQQLSQARAYNVAVFLQNETGLPANMFIRYGYGASKMIPSSGKKTGLAANRRVEVRIFLPDGDV